MKTLLILRHAKSSWEDPGLRDHDRPLNPRGMRDAPRMGRHIAELGIEPTRIISSTAVRASATAELVAAELDPSPEIETVRDLYLSGPGSYLDAVIDYGGDADCVMVVGHNPDITAFVTRLTNECKEMPTAALAQVELDVEDWADLRPGTRGTLEGHWVPKKLPND